MATNEVIDTDILWEEMKNLAIEQQQCFYEFLPDCKIYQHDEHKYLKYDIGYTIYGPPKVEDANTTENNDVSGNIQESKNEDQDIADIAAYDKKRDVITIYNKILECTKETVDSQTIYFSVIYNIIFRSKIKSNKKKKQNVKTEVEKKMPDIEKKERKEKKEFLVLPVPIFKIRKSHLQMNIKNTKEKKALLLTESEADYTTCYIDNNGRVYKDWTDYITKNTLPQCTMVIPKDGYYQPDMSQPITEDYSTVYLDIIDSPACKLTTKLCKGIDIVNGAIGVGTVSLGIASLFTPLAPVVALSGLVAAGATGAWSFGRSSQRLYDHKAHEGSLLDKEILPQWLGIAGTTLSLGAIGGTLFISTVVEHGIAISNSTKIVFNTMQGGNILLNSVCIAHQIYSMIDKHGTIIMENIIDWLAHIMFFNSFVMNVRFAEIIIKDTHGKIIDDYRQSLPNRRFREAYNRVRQNATVKNSGCKISENAQVICYVTDCTQLLSSENFSSNNSITDQASSKSVNIIWSFEDHKLIVNGIVLLDPIEFTRHLTQLDILRECNQDKTTFGSHDYDNNINEHLLKTLNDLLIKFYLSSDRPKSENLPTIFDFEPFLKEMTSMNINEDFLSKLFIITAKLCKHSKNTDDFLFKAFYFIWMYCKENLKQWGVKSCYRMQSIAVTNLLKKIIVAIFEAIDMMISSLHIAFIDYIEASLHN